MPIKFKKSVKAKKERMNQIISLLSTEYPNPKIELDYNSPFELLVATVLSAQCTDKRVNVVTKELFKKYPTPTDYHLAPVEEVEQIIYSTGFYRAKAKNIKGIADAAVNIYNDSIPSTMEELLTLPGVGRKSANVVLGHCFDTPGIVVDTHVIRLSNRLGFVNNKNPVKIEFELMKFVPSEVQVDFTHYFILHGRRICKSRRADCDNCFLCELCPAFGIV